MDINFVQVPGVGEVMLSMENIWYIRAGGLAVMEGAFVDHVSVTHLPAGGDWPPEASSMVTWFDGIPELAMIRVVGPVTIDVVCAVLSIMCGLEDSNENWQRN